MSMGDIKNCILDTGTSLTYLPEAVLDELVWEIGWCEEEEGIYFCECESILDIMPIWINFNGEAVEMESKDFVIFDDKEKLCYLMLSYAEDDEEVLLGDSFLRGKYIVHDVAGKQVGFSNTKLAMVRANIWVGFIVLIIIILCCCTCICCCVVICICLCLVFMMKWRRAKVGF
jgi:hypothetical protein